MGVLLPILIPLLPGIIQGVESLFRAKKGKEKKDVAIVMASAVLKKLREDGVFTGSEGAKEVADLVEAVFQIMKSTGQLQEAKDGEPAPVSAPQRVVFEGVLRSA